MVRYMQALFWGLHSRPFLEAFLEQKNGAFRQCRARSR